MTTGMPSPISPRPAPISAADFHRLSGAQRLPPKAACGADPGRPATAAGGCPSRISPRPAPTSGRRPSMAGSGHPPAAAAGPKLSSHLGKGQRQGTSGRRYRDFAEPLWISMPVLRDERLLTAERTSVVVEATPAVPAVDFRAGPRERQGPSRAPRGVLPAGHGWPAAGRGSWTRTPAGGAHPAVRATGSANHDEAALGRTNTPAVCHRPQPGKASHSLKPPPAIAFAAAASALRLYLPGGREPGSGYPCRPFV